MKNLHYHKPIYFILKNNPSFPVISYQYKTPKNQQRKELKPNCRPSHDDMKKMNNINYGFKIKMCRTVLKISRFDNTRHIFTRNKQQQSFPPTSESGVIVVFQSNNICMALT